MEANPLPVGGGDEQRRGQRQSGQRATATAQGQYSMDQDQEMRPADDVVPSRSVDGHRDRERDSYRSRDEDDRELRRPELTTGSALLADIWLGNYFTASVSNIVVIAL